MLAGSDEDFLAKWVVLQAATKAVTRSRGQQELNLHNITDNLGLYQALCEAVERLPVNSIGSPQRDKRLDEVILTNKQANLLLEVKTAYFAAVEFLFVCSDLIDFLIAHKFKMFFDCCLAYSNFEPNRITTVPKFSTVRDNTVQLMLLGLLEFTLMIVHINFTQLDLSTPVENSIPAYVEFIKNMKFAKTNLVLFYLGYISKLLNVLKDRSTTYLYKHRHQFHDAANSIGSYIDPEFVIKPLSNLHFPAAEFIHKSTFAAQYQSNSNNAIQQSNMVQVMPYSQRLNSELTAHRLSLEDEDPNTMDTELQKRIIKVCRPLAVTFQDHKCFTEIHSKLCKNEDIEFTDAHATVRDFVELILQHIYTSQ
jgi:hypothetical protein